MRMASRIFARLGLAAVAAAALAAPSFAEELKVWKHGILQPKSDAGFVEMAAKGGFAKKLGLDLQLVPVKNETLALRALIAGDLDSYEGSPAFAAVARGSDVKMIGCYWVGLPHALFVRQGITKPKDLEGKTLATSAPGSLPDLLAHATLDHYGIPDSKVKFANVGGDADRYRALTTGVVDGAYVSSEYAPEAAKSHISILVRARDAVPNFVRLCYNTTTKTLKDRPEDTVHFLEANMEALRYALSHKAETVKLAREASGEKEGDPRAAYVYEDTVKTHSIDPTLAFPMAKLEGMQKLLLKSGATPKPVDISKMIDSGPREKALAALKH